MSPREVLRFAFIGLLANKVRSALTMLGILIGVGAVILLVAVGQGSAVAVEQSIESLGSNTITVMEGGDGGFGGAPAAAASSENSTDTGTDVQNQDLTLADTRALNNSAAAPHIQSASPEVTASVDCAANTTSASTTVTGTWPAYFEATNSPVAQGDYFYNGDVVDAAKVAVIGQTVAESLFGTQSPVGEIMTCSGVQFTIVGVLESKGSTGFQDSDDTVIAPISAVQQNLSGYGALSGITVQAVDADSVDEAQQEVTSVLSEQHDLAEGDTGSWQVLSSETIASALTESSDVFTVLLGAVAAISLLVGGIGITNIMLVTVTERTREIGIRKAIGASRGVILAQFLVEATVLSVIGGAIGVLAGVVGSTFDIAGVTPVLVPYSIALAFGVAFLIGLFFGSYPANRAASLRPIEALRYE